MTNSDDVPAIPLWLAGHAYLTLAPRFIDVCEARSGKVLRRTPACGADAAHRALSAARQALPAWSERPASARAGLLMELGNALDGYAGHFSRLIEEESSGDGASASAEVRDAVAVLRSAPQAAADVNAMHDAKHSSHSNHSTGASVQAIFGSAQAPLGALLRIAVPAWCAGAALVVVQPPQAPAAVFALAELSARCAFPAGVFNVLYGDAAEIGALLDREVSVSYA